MMGCRNFLSARIFGLLVFVVISSRVQTKPLSQGLEQAFNALTSTTHPGVYHAQIRGYMTGGSAQIHFPSYAVDLVSLSPPHYAAGCNGIDIYLGGLSYISGDQFVNLLKSIAANTMGYSFGLAMRTLCPVCATTVGQLQKVAQAANKLAINQCQFAMGLVNSTTSEQAETRTASMAALESARLGKTKDFLAGINAVGNDVSKALSMIAKSLSRIHDKGSQSQALQSMELGSDTWKLLSGLNTAQKLFIQSLLGTTVRYPYPTKHPRTLTVVPIAASMSVQQLVDLFMYGVTARHPNNATILVNDCASLPQGSHALDKLLAENENILCTHVVKKRIDQSSWYSQSKATIHGISLVDHGFFGLTYALLFQALSNIKQAKPLGTPAYIQLPLSIYGADHTRIEVNFKKSDIEAFISVAPLPLYRAINIAAVYPSISAALITNVAEVIAAHYAATYLNQTLLNTQGQGIHSNGLIGLSPEKLHKLERALNEIHQRLHRHIGLLLKNRQAEQAWINQVNRIQEKLYMDSVHSITGISR